MVKSNIYIVPFIETRYLKNSFNVMYNTHRRLGLGEAETMVSRYLHCGHSHNLASLSLSRAPVQWCGIKIFIFLGVLRCVAKCSVYNSPMFHWSPGSGVTLIWCWYGSLFIFIVLRCCSYFYIDTAAARPSHYTEQHLSWMEHCRSLGTSFLLHIVHWNILLTTTQKAFILHNKDQKIIQISNV